MFSIRRTLRFVVAAAAVPILSAFLISPLFAVANPQSSQNSPGWWYAEGVLILNFKPEITKSEFRVGKGEVKTGLKAVDALFGKYQVESFEKLFVGAEKPLSRDGIDLSNYYRINFDAKESLDKAFADFSALDAVEHVERAGVHPVLATPNDPSFGSQWGLNQTNDRDIDAPEAWDSEVGDSAILVGAMDTGVQWNHPDLAGAAPYTNGNIWINWAEYNGLPGVDDDGNGYIDDIRGWDWVTGVSAWPGEDGSMPDNDPMDFNGHGTHTAGIMAAITNNSIGVAGVAGGWGPSQRGCRIVPLRIGWSQSYAGIEMGYVRMDFAAQAFYYATQIGVTAVNCSWGSSNDGAFGAAVTNAINNGMVVVSAAGNDGNQTQSYLCSRSDVIAVASLTSSGSRSSFSNYGTWVDVSAPGSDIYATYSNHGSASYATLSGTSMAAPFVTGLAGLLRSRLHSLSGDVLDTLIVNSAENIDAQNPSYIGRLGSGRINANNAISRVFAAQIISGVRFGPAPLTVSFSGSSPDQVDAWMWHFGDGDSAAGQSVVHEYPLPGSYDVSLRISGSNGVNTTNLPGYVVVYADTIQMMDFAGDRTMPLVCDVRLKNFAPIASITLPLIYSGNMDISLDSVSVVGTRGVAFERVQIEASSFANYIFSLKMVANNGGGSPPLPQGDGTLFRMFFKYDQPPPVAGVNIIDTTRFSTFAYRVVSTLGAYNPTLIAGTINVTGGMRGDADLSGFINISDAIYLISYIFSGGEPPPTYNGDADCNGFINISDVTYLIAYIFNSGPPPC
jgi:subtilisin family serine protease